MRSGGGGGVKGRRATTFILPLALVYDVDSKDLSMGRGKILSLRISCSVFGRLQQQSYFLFVDSLRFSLLSSIPVCYICVCVQCVLRHIHLNGLLSWLSSRNFFSGRGAKSIVMLIFLLSVDQISGGRSLWGGLLEGAPPAPPVEESQSLLLKVDIIVTV